MSDAPNVSYVTAIHAGLALTPATHTTIRQQVLAWSLDIRTPDEPWSLVLERAQAFLDFLLEPMREGVADAFQARLEATIN